MLCYDELTCRGWVVWAVGLCPWAWAWAWPCLCALCGIWPGTAAWCWRPLWRCCVWWGRWATGTLTGGLGGWGPLPGDLCWTCFLGNDWNCARAMAGGGVGGCGTAAAGGGACVCGPGWSSAAWVCCLRFWKVWVLWECSLSAACVRLLGLACEADAGPGAVPPWRGCLAPFATGCASAPLSCAGFWLGSALRCGATCACGRWLGSAKALVSLPRGALSPCWDVCPCETTECPTETSWLEWGLVWGLLSNVLSCLEAIRVVIRPLMPCWAGGLLRVWSAFWIAVVLRVFGMRSAERLLVSLSVGTGPFLAGALLWGALSLWDSGLFWTSLMGGWGVLSVVLEELSGDVCPCRAVPPGYAGVPCRRSQGICWGDKLAGVFSLLEILPDVLRGSGSCRYVCVFALRCKVVPLCVYPVGISPAWAASRWPLNRSSFW